MPNKINFGTFSVRGIHQENDKDDLPNDAKNDNLDIISVSETHIGEETNTYVLKEYVLYTVNGKESKNTHGTGILVKKEFKPKFERISDRICTTEIPLKHCKLIFISAYADTLEKSEKNHEEREEFYETLETIIDSIPKRDAVILADDFNARTGSGYNEFKENMGKFGKGQINSSGRRLLEMCKRTDMVISNTLFERKMCHQATWTATFRNFTTWNGEARKNPIRNQIDYIMVRNKYKAFITNSRSYGGITKDSDHKLVKTEMHLQWTKMQKQNTKSHKIDTRAFTAKEKQDAYKEKVTQANRRRREKSGEMEKDM